MQKIALITGITGQDGAYLAEFLLNKGYYVHGINRGRSQDRIDHLCKDMHETDTRFVLHYGDLTDSTNLIRIIQEVQPDEIYNLAAQSHVQVAVETPEYTSNAEAVGTLRLLEAIRLLRLTTKTRFCQVATSELFGKAQKTPQKETTSFYPRSLYAAAKIFGYWITVNYREAYGLYACNGILFNHESPISAGSSVARKITRAAARIKLGAQESLYLGNLDAKRDWGYAGDYVKAIWMMLQQEQPEDYVIATGETHSVREFVELAFKNAGIDIVWRGSGWDEKGVDAANGKEIVQVNPRYFRPTEIDFLLGDPTKATKKLGWKPETSFEKLVSMMVAEDLKNTERDLLYKKNGFKVNNWNE